MAPASAEDRPMARHRSLLAHSRPRRRFADPQRRAKLRPAMYPAVLLSQTDHADVTPRPTRTRQPLHLYLNIYQTTQNSGIPSFSAAQVQIRPNHLWHGSGIL